MKKVQKLKLLRNNYNPEYLKGIEVLAFIPLFLEILSDCKIVDQEDLSLKP